MTDTDTAQRAVEYRAAYDARLRHRVPTESADWFTAVGPALRDEGSTGPGVITYRNLDGLAGDTLDAFIAAQRDHFAARGRAVEWKYHLGDQPADLPERLAAAGFVADEPETVMIGATADLANGARPPAGVRLREVTGRGDLERLRAFQRDVWGVDSASLPDTLGREINGAADRTTVLLAEVEGAVVCAAWIRFHHGTGFASLWGGSTLPQWRRKGIYRAMVAYRAALAVEHGYRLLQVDASADSAPILTRLGLLAITTTTPYVWNPPADVAD